MSATVHAGQHRHRTSMLSRGACFVVCIDGAPIVALDRIGGRTVLASGTQNVTFSAAALAITDPDESEDLAYLVADASNWVRPSQVAPGLWLLDASDANPSRTTFAVAPGGDS